MNSKKFVLLFLALLVPSIVFIFLKRFGSNQFDVEVLYEDRMPAFTDDCDVIYSTPYHLPDSVTATLNERSDSAVFVFFGEQDAAFVTRVLGRYKGDPVGYKLYDTNNPKLKKCIFILEEPFDVALVDSKGRIRGQYNSTEREEVDRLITELAILIRKY